MSLGQQTLLFEPLVKAKPTPEITKAKKQLKQSLSSLQYERGRMMEELTGSGYGKADAEAIILNAEVKPATVKKLVESLDLDSKSLTALRRCIKNVDMLVKRIKPLKRILKIPAGSSLNGFKK